MNTCSQMTGYYLFKRLYKKNRLLSVVTWDSKNIEDPGSTLIMKFKKRKNRLENKLVRGVSCKTWLLCGVTIIGVTISVRG